MATQKVIYDAFGGVARVLHYDDRGPWDGDFAIETVQDCEPIIEENKRLREAGASVEEGWKLLGRVPVDVAERAWREGWYHDEAKWSAWLNDPDNRAFRVYEGRV